MLYSEQKSIPTVVGGSTNSPNKTATCLKLVALSALFVAVVGCGTLTGIPSHGGGKRFAIEQRLVSTTIRGAIKEIDLTELRGKTVFLQITSINDQGAGNMIGGRASMIFALQGITESSPITSVKNTFKVFDLSSSSSTSNSRTSSGGSNTSTTYSENVNSASSSTTVNNVNSTGSSSSTSVDNGSGTNTSTTNGSNTNTSSGSATSTTDGSDTSTSTTDGSNTNTSTTDIDATTTGSGTNTNTTDIDSTTTTNGSGTIDSSGTTNTTTTTGAVVTTQNGANTNDTDTTNTSTTTVDGTNVSNGSNTSTSTTDGTNVTNSSGTNTSTTNGSGTNTSTTNATNTATGSGTNSSTTNGSSTNTNTGTTDANNTQSTTSDSATNSNFSQSTNGGSRSNTNNFQNTSSSSSESGSEQRIANQPETTETQTKGTGYKGSYGVDYRGQGSYANFNVPVSDVGILQSIVRTYFYLNDVKITLDPNNPTIEAIVNINVDVFGSIRSRLDTVVYNKETVKVQTVLEVMAIDKRDHTLVMLPQTGSYEAIYDEKYAFWIGPLNKNNKRIKHHSMGAPMLVSFADVAAAKVERDRLAASQRPVDNAMPPVAAQRPTNEPTELMLIQKTLSTWLKAWEERDVAAYLAFYSPSFVPHTGVSVARWKRERTDKLTVNQNIKINLKNVKILMAPDQVHAKVTFLQDYRSNRYQDNSIKTLELEKVAGQWRIIREES